METTEILEKVPTELMKEITADIQAEGSFLSEAGSHTSITDSKPLDKPFMQPEAGSQSLNAGNLITGSMAVGFIDIMLPALIVLISVKMGKQINKNQLSTTQKERDMISPVLQNYLNSVNFNVDSPLNALLITLAMVYGTKTIEVLNGTPQAPQQAPSPLGSMYNKDGTIKKDGRGRPKKS